MARYISTTLSNGSEVQVKRLGLFEIEQNIPKPNLEPYHIEGDINGKKYRQLYVLDYERPKPNTPFDECEKGTAAYWDWIEWHNWQDGLAYLANQADELTRHFEQVEQYIIDNCLSDDDRNLLETWQDFDKIYQIAIPDIPDIEYLEQLAETVFQAKWGEVAAFEAYNSLEGSEGSYAWIPQQIWRLIVKLGETEDRFLDRSKREIGMLMVAELLPDMMSALQVDKQHKEIKAKATDGNKP